MGAVLQQLGQRVHQYVSMGPGSTTQCGAVWLATGCLVVLWLAKEATMLFGFVLAVPLGLDTGLVQTRIVDSDMRTGPFIPVVVCVLSL